MFGPDPRTHKSKIDFMPSKTIKIQTSNGRSMELVVRIAYTFDTRTAGFQHADLDDIENNIVLFVFEKESVGKFHMENVIAPLDLALINSDGEILEILKMDPGTEHFGIEQPIQFALEARAGFFAELAIHTGESFLVLESID